MDLCETISIIAFKKRIPWTLFISFGSRSKLNKAFEFLYRENAEYNGAERKVLLSSFFVKFFLF